MRSLLSRLSSWIIAGPRSIVKMVRGRYDAAQTTDENARHWANADYLSARSALLPGIRRTLRARSRYEVANNSFAAGIAATIANYTIGTGPRLALTVDGDPDPKITDRIEDAFHAWAKRVDLASKLWTARHARVVDGESILVLTTDPRAPEGEVSLDVVPIEADRLATPTGQMTPTVDPKFDDGIELEGGYPKRYWILRHHPGDGFPSATTEADAIDAANVIHTFRRKRPGQLRGVPETTPALPLFALLRRYTLAVLGTAEQAAMVGGVIYTDAPAQSDIPELDTLDPVDIQRGEWLTMPFGWKVGQIKGEQPITAYGEFRDKIIGEISRCMNVPFTIAIGDSSSSNYSSGRLDAQAFHRDISIERTVYIGPDLDRIFAAWLEEARRIPGLLVPRGRQIKYKVEWYWDGFAHVDPLKEEEATKVALESGTTTLREIYASQGRDWRRAIEQRGEEVKLCKKLGITPEEPPPGAAPKPKPKSKESP